MRERTALCVAILAASVWLGSWPAFSQRATDSTSPDDQTPAYRPPLRGAPASRVGGGSRGPGDPSVQISVIAPDHTGLTLQEQPSLYWHASGPVSAPVEITLIDEVSVKPLIAVTIQNGVARGLHELRTSEFGVRLNAGVEYRWHVALVLDPEQRSKDVIASGTIRRAVLAEETRIRLARTQGDAAVFAYAEQGIWYDAIDALAKLMRGEPSNTLLIRHYQSLLKQVGLASVAALK